MAKQLSDRANDFLLGNTKLYADVCDILEVRPSSLMTLIARKSERLTKYEVVLSIAIAMDIDPDDVLIDTAKVEA